MAAASNLANKKHRKGPRTLAEEVANFVNPQPAFQDEDPELRDFGHEAFGGNEDSEASEDDGYLAGPSKGKPGKLPLRGSIALDDGAYAGKTSSRQRALDEGGSSEHSDEGGSSEHSDEGGDFEHSDDDIIGDAAFENGSLKGLQNGAASDEEGSEEAGSDDELAGGSERQENEGGEEEDELEREYREMREQEEALLASVQKRASVDRTKGAAVSNQRSLWNTWLELRISLHKLVLSGSRLPRPDARALFVESVPDVRTGLESLSAVATGTLEKLLATQQALLEQNDAIAAAREQAVNENGKRGRSDNEGTSAVDRLWEQMDAQYTSWRPYRDASVDRWQRKTLLATGAAAGRGKLRAINQSVTAQIASALRNPTRLLSRTRLKTDDVQAFGQSAFPAAPRDEDPSSARTVEDEEPAASQPPDEDLDPETFDDTDFYQQLLKEFLDSSGASSGMSQYAMQKLRNNKKKVVDRRASKGRKIRYTVQQPLLNFMAPEPMSIPPMADKLFANLFGERGEKTSL